MAELVSCHAQITDVADFYFLSIVTTKKYNLRCFRNLELFKTDIIVHIGDLWCDIFGKYFFLENRQIDVQEFSKANRSNSFGKYYVCMMCLPHAPLCFQIMFV